VAPKEQKSSDISLGGDFDASTALSEINPRDVEFVTCVHGRVQYPMSKLLAVTRIIRRRCLDRGGPIYTGRKESHITLHRRCRADISREVPDPA
jgi:hypothetical protein